MGAFLALDNIEFNFLAFFKSLEAFAADTCIMHEYLVSFLLTDKSKPSLVIESSDYTLTHVVTSKLCDE